jgi:hypothetical protein
MLIAANGFCSSQARKFFAAAHIAGTQAKSVNEKGAVNEFAGLPTRIRCEAAAALQTERARAAD